MPDANIAVGSLEALLSVRKTVEKVEVLPWSADDEVRYAQLPKDILQTPSQKWQFADSC
jgi:hypothetical protein